MLAGRLTSCSHRCVCATFPLAAWQLSGLRPPVNSRQLPSERSLWSLPGSPWQSCLFLGTGLSRPGSSGHPDCAPLRPLPMQTRLDSPTKSEVLANISTHCQSELRMCDCSICFVAYKHLAVVAKNLVNVCPDQDDLSCCAHPAGEV